MKNPMHNPLPASLSSECKKAAAILESFIDPKLKIDGQIPRKIFEGAKGIAIYTAFRVGFLGSIRFGSGLIVARMADGSWTAPSAIGMCGLGAGGQFGAELTDFVFVLNTDAAVKTFMQSGSLTLGGNISMAVGPVGRSAEASGVVGTKGAAGVFAYSKTRGLYGGLTVEGGVLIERTDANKKIYGRKVRARELLNGLTPPPPEAEVLMKVLNGSFFQFESGQTADQEQSTDGVDTAAYSSGAQNVPNTQSPSGAEQTDDPQQVAEAEQTNEPQQTGEAQGHSESEQIDETQQASQAQELEADQIKPVVETQDHSGSKQTDGPQQVSEADQTNKPRQTGEAQNSPEPDHIDETHQANQSHEFETDQVKPVEEAQQATDTEEAIDRDQPVGAERAVESQQIKDSTSENPIENAGKEDKKINQDTESISKYTHISQPKDQQPISAEEHAPDDSNAPPEKPRDTQRGGEKE